MFLHLFFFGFDGQLNDFLLDKVKAEPALFAGEPKGRLDFVRNGTYIRVSVRENIKNQNHSN